MTSIPVASGRPFSAVALASAAALLVAGCNAASPSRPVTLAELVAAAPTSSSVELDVAGAAGMSDPTLAPMASLAPAVGAAAAGNALLPGTCHPHLFSRTAEVVWRVNWIFHRHLRHVEALIARHPDLLAGDTATWTDSGPGQAVQRRFTISRSADGHTYSYELDLALAGQAPPTWVTILTGSLTDLATTTGRSQSAAMTFDYDALHGVVPAEPLTGRIDLATERVKDETRPAPGVKRSSTVSFVNFAFGAFDPHGPRTGTSQHLSEPGLGGAMAFQDSLVLLCPPNPAGLAADTVTHSRWYLDSSGVHGRADARASGGQMATGETWLGVTCYQGASGLQPMAAGEAGYWAMKLEDATGATVAGTARSAGTGATACDPAFGPVPSLTDSATDHDFTAPLTFPGRW